MRSESTSDIYELITDYIKPFQNDLNHRYKSWEHCYKYFNKIKGSSASPDYDSAALHLAFYLASWGMYRGSSFLLQKDYKIHIPAVQVIFSEKYNNLWNVDYKSFLRNGKLIDLLFELRDEIIETYIENISYINGVEKQINVTETLITKIILGTLGCVPAYDSYFVQGLKNKNFINSSFCKNSIYELAYFYNQNIIEFTRAKEKVKEFTEFEYPFMKLIDMYFWQMVASENIKETTESHNTTTDVVKQPNNDVNENNDTNVIRVREVLYDAATHLDGTFTMKDIKNYVKEKYSNVNEETLTRQVNICTVNRQSRINWSYNKKERIANSNMDFLYVNEDKTLELYKPDIHGIWEIIKDNENFVVRKKAM